MSSEQEDRWDDSPILDCIHVAHPSPEWIPSKPDSLCSIPPSDVQPRSNILSFVPESEQETISAYANTWSELLILTASLLSDDDSRPSMQTTPQSDNGRKILSLPGSCDLTKLQTEAFTDWWIRSSNHYHWLASVVQRRLDEKPEAHFTRVISSLSKSKCPEEALLAWKAWYRVIKLCTDNNFEQRQAVKRKLRSQADIYTALQRQAWMTTRSYSMESVFQPQYSSWQTSQGRTLEDHDHPARECPNPHAVLKQVGRTIADLRATLDSWRLIEDHAAFASLTPTQALEAGAWQALLQVKDNQ